MNSRNLLRQTLFISFIFISFIGEKGLPVKAPSLSVLAPTSRFAHLYKNKWILRQFERMEEERLKSKTIHIKKSPGTRPFKSAKEYNDFLSEFEFGVRHQSVRGGLMVLPQITAAVMNANSKQRVSQIVSRLKKIHLDPSNPIAKKYIEAGWNSINWEQFSEALLIKLEELREDLAYAYPSFEILFHDLDNELGFIVDEKTPPVFAFSGTIRDRKKIYVTKKFITLFDRIGSSKDKKFAIEILFHAIFEDQVLAILQEIPGVSTPETLKNPITTALEPLMEIDPNVPFKPLPLMSEAQKRILLYAAENGMKEYLEDVLSEDHPLDFDKSFSLYRNKYLYLLDILNSAKETGVIRNKLDRFFKKIEEELLSANPSMTREAKIENIIIKSTILNGEDLPERYWGILIESFQITHFLNPESFGYNENEIIKILMFYIKELLEEEVQTVSFDVLNRVNKGPLSEGYRIDEKDGLIFYKTALTNNAVKFLFYEHETYSRLLSENNANLSYFIDFIDPEGPRIFKSNSKYFIGIRMRYAENSLTLNRFIHDSTFIQTDAAAILDIFKQLLYAHSFLKENGIVIRDTKPDNILLLNEDGKIKVKVIDFGLAHLIDNSPFSNVPGTPLYFSPEEAKAHIEEDLFSYTFQQDLWKVGVTFYNLLTKGHYPFELEEVDHDKTSLIGEEETATKSSEDPKKRFDPLINGPIRDIDTDEFTDIRLKALTEIVYYMLRSKDPDKRYTSTEEVLEKIQLLEKYYENGVLAELMKDDAGIKHWKQIIQPKQSDLKMNHIEIMEAAI